MSNGKTFIKITNRDVYEKLESIEKGLGKIKGTLLWHSWAISLLAAIVVAVAAAAR